MCVLCDSDEETATHLFTGCVYMAEIWSRIEAWCRLSPTLIFQVSDLLKTPDLQNCSKLNRYILRGIIITTIWAVWSERNDRIFKDKRHRAVNIVATIKSTSYFWIRNRSRFKNIDRNVWCICPLNLL